MNGICGIYDTWFAATQAAKECEQRGLRFEIIDESFAGSKTIRPMYTVWWQS